MQVLVRLHHNVSDIGIDAGSVQQRILDGQQLALPVRVCRTLQAWVVGDRVREIHLSDVMLLHKLLVEPLGFQPRAASAINIVSGIPDACALRVSKQEG